MRIGSCEINNKFGIAALSSLGLGLTTHYFKLGRAVTVAGITAPWVALMVYGLITVCRGEGGPITAAMRAANATRPPTGSSMQDRLSRCSWRLDRLEGHPSLANLN